MPGSGAEQVPLYPQNTVVTNVTGKNDVQTVKVDATSGNYTLEWEDVKSPNLAFNLTAAELQVKIEALSEYLVGSVTVTGGPGNSGGTTPYVVTYGGKLAKQAVPVLVGASVSLSGGGAAVTITHTTTGEGVPSNAVQRGTGLADRTGNTAPQAGTSAAEQHTTNTGSKFE